MKIPSAETIAGPRAKTLLHHLIDSRRLLKLRIPETPYCWITLLSEIQTEGGADLLLIDGVAGFGEALSHSRTSEVALEYQEPGGIFCWFESAVVRSSPRAIRVKCPEVIYRVQRRKFYRLEAERGTEVLFSILPDQEVRATVRDYSLGGLAFTSERALPLEVNEEVKDLHLRIPEGKGWLVVSIPLAVVRRAESQKKPASFLYAVEYAQFPEHPREKLARHIFEKQRDLLRRLGKNLSAPGVAPSGGA